MKKISLVLLKLLLLVGGFAQTKSLKLAEYRRIINEVNSMELKQVEPSINGSGFVYYDSNGLVRKHSYHFRSESEQVIFVSYYDKTGNAIFIAYQAGNNIEEEKGFVYLAKGNIVLQNSITYPYYEEYYLDGKLITEGEKGGFIAKTNGKFLYQTPLFKMNLSIYATVDSLKKYYYEYDDKSIDLSEKAMSVNFSKADIAYVTSCNGNDGIRKLPDMASPIVDSITYVGASLKLLEKCKVERIGSWGFNHWYKVEYGEEVGYIYGAFLEPANEKK